MNNHLLKAQLLLTGVCWLFWLCFGSDYDGFIFTIVLLTTGIPHGANDLQLLRQRYPTLSVMQAFVRYILLVLAAAGLMAGFPLVGLLLFLGLSAYHFGQGDLYEYVVVSQSHLAGWLYLSWGVLLLTALLGIHARALGYYLPQTSELSGLIRLMKLLPTGIWVYTTLSAGLLIIAVWGGYITLSFALRRFIVTGLLFALFARTSLLFSFCVYFGIWHSVEAIGIFAQRLYQSRPSVRVRQFYIHGLPLTVLAGGLLGGLVYTGHYVHASSPLLFWLFTFLFGLTVPHVLVSESIYRRHTIGVASSGTGS